MKHFLPILAALFISISAIAQPVITQNPSDNQACVDSCATFSVAAVGSGLNYFWMTLDSAQSPTLIGNGDTLSLCDSIVQYDSMLVYCVVVDNNGDSAVSSQALLTVDSCIAPVANFEFTWNWELREVCFENTSRRAETVLWIFGDGNTEAGNQQSVCHSYDSLELFYVKLHAFNNYGEDVVEKAIDLLGVEEISNQFSVFPNPSDEVVFIESDEMISSVALTDLNGRTIRTSFQTDNRHAIALSGLSAGVYTLSIESESGTVFKRIVKQ